jgi:radical SAM family uncharacterized protein
MPWPDMARSQRERGIPLWSLESRAPVRDFDVLGFSLQFEAGYTTALEMLDLAGLPIFSEQRDESHPLVIGGGPCAYNPEPLAPFFDAFVVGEGEQVVGEISDLMIAWKQGHGSKAELLEGLAKIPGVYVPSFFQPVYAADHTLAAMEPLRPGYEHVSRRLMPDLNEVPQPDRPIVPFMQTVHDRLPIEIQRGCVRGCRFCQVGMLTRPARQRDPRKVLEIAERGLAATGYEEVGFLSLSAGDYGCINGLLEAFFQRFAPERVAISLPSLRTETMNDSLARLIGKVKKTGFTIAPEAATDRLRRVINKGNTEENLLKAIESTFGAGWSLVKLYFMIGLPTETDEDVQAIGDLAQKAFRLSRSIRSGTQIHVSVSTFVPKPLTPFQWEPMLTMEETIRRHGLLRSRFQHKGALALKYHDAKGSMVEGALARGDRRAATAVLAAWRAGQILDGWTEHFDFERWAEAFRTMEREHGISMEFLANRERREDEALPWDRIDSGVRKAYLLQERARSRAGELQPTCAGGKCAGCGACDFDQVKNRLYEPQDVPVIAAPLPEAAGPAAVAEADSSDSSKAPIVRVRYGKTARGAAVSHLETMAVLLRALRRSGLPVLFTQGFSPKPRVSFSPACPVGVESSAELIDVLLTRTIPAEEVAKALRAVLPDPYPLLSVEQLPHGAPNLAASITALSFKAFFAEGIGQGALADRAVELAGLAEAAAAGAAAENLNHRTVVDDVHVRHDRRRRVVELIEVLDDALPHHRRHVRVARLNRSHGAVRMVSHVIE